MKRNHILATAFVCVAGLTSTTFAGGDKNKQQQPAQTEAKQAPTTADAPMAPECPEFIQGSKLSVSNVKGGVAVKVTTSKQTYVPPLRELLRDFVSAVEQQQQTAPADQDPAMAQIPPLDISAKNVDGGTLLTVRAERPGDVETIRTQARGIETAWKSSTCIHPDQTARR